MDLRGHSLLTMHNYDCYDLMYLVKLSEVCKLRKKSGILDPEMRGKNIALIFELPSTRTRCAFEIAAHDLGLGVSNLDLKKLQIGDKESLEDTAKILGRLYDGIEYRGRSQEKINMMAKYSKVPVWNGLTEEFHPTQGLADLLTMWEHFRKLEGLNVAYFGDARNNVAKTLMIACTKMGINIKICSPKSYFPKKSFVEECGIYAFQTGCKIEMTEDPDDAASGSDVIYTDVWLPLGANNEKWSDRIKDLLPYKVTKEIMEKANKDAIFMHSLPSFHDMNTEIGQRIYKKYGLKEMEVSDEVFKSKQSKVFVQAENRVHTIKALMMATLNC